MSVRKELLALLVPGPRHDYQLKNDYDAALGDPKPLNMGQVYITLERLARDRLIEKIAPSTDVSRYITTDPGRAVRSPRDRHIPDPP